MNQQTPTPRSDFTRRSTAEEVTRNIDLRGKTVLITGCNSGLGFETMRVLVKRGAHVIGVARTRKKAQDAGAEVGADPHFEKAAGAMLAPTASYGHGLSFDAAGLRR